MTEMLRTVHQIVHGLGGPRAVAVWAGFASDSAAVHNWLSRDEIPPSWHMRLMIEAKRRGKLIDPKAFGLTDDEASDLRDALVGVRDAVREPCEAIALPAA